MVILTGLLRSLHLTAIGAIGFAEIGKEYMGQASSLQNRSQRLAQSVGVAVGAYALELSSVLQHHASIVTSDFRPAFLVVGLIAGLSVFYNIALALRPRADHQRSNRTVAEVPRRQARSAIARKLRLVSVLRGFFGAEENIISGRSN